MKNEPVAGLWWCVCRINGGTAKDTVRRLVRNPLVGYWIDDAMTYGPKPRRLTNYPIFVQIEELVSRARADKDFEDILLELGNSGICG